jgi:hypothetical protein
MRSDGQFLHLAAARGGMPGTEEYLRQQSPWPIHGLLPASRCVAQQALIHIQDAESDASLNQELRDLARTRGWRACLAVPLLRDRGRTTPDLCRPGGDCGGERAAAGRASNAYS